MNNNDERDYAEEAYNRRLLENPDGETPQYPEPGAYEGYVQYAAGEIVSLQCHEGRCGACPADHANPDDDSRPLRAQLGPVNCEHACDGTGEDEYDHSRAKEDARNEDLDLTAMLSQANADADALNKIQGLLRNARGEDFLPRAQLARIVAGTGRRASAS